jgi:hypothetical protein
MTEARRERILAGELAPDVDPLVSAVASQPEAGRLRDALVLAEGFELNVIGCETPRVARALMSSFTCRSRNTWPLATPPSTASAARSLIAPAIRAGRR